MEIKYDVSKYYVLKITHEFALHVNSKVQMAKLMAFGYDDKNSEVRPLFTVSHEKMTIYGLMIYDSKGTCLYSVDWNRTSKSKDPEGDKKLMYGLLFSLKIFVQKTSPKGYGVDCDEKCEMKSYTTSSYRLNLYESASGLKFLLLSDPSAGDVHEVLRHIYSNIYIDYVVKNPLYEPGSKVVAEKFHTEVDRYVRSLSMFVSE